MIPFIGLAVLSFVLYGRLSMDTAPDSIAGYLYAIIGTSLVILALVGFSLKRRSSKRAVGQLHGSLNWHICFGLVGLVILFLHSFGNFNPRTGTYALYGMVALAISGVIGRTLDRLVPAIMTKVVRKTLTRHGEDRIERISQQLQSIALHDELELHSFHSAQGSLTGIPQLLSQPGNTGGKKNVTRAGDSAQGILHTSWDLAYLSLERTPEELSTPSMISGKVESPVKAAPMAEQHMEDLEEVQQALHHEQIYRYIIRYWRIFHIFLALVTIGLTIWHLVYAAQLLLPAYLMR